MDKLRAEQQAVQAKHGQRIMPAALKEMPFADAVLRWVQSRVHVKPHVAYGALCSRLLILQQRNYCVSASTLCCVAVEDGDHGCAKLMLTWCADMSCM
jgi:hypothetical protein